MAVEKPAAPQPTISIVEVNGPYAKFAMEPLARGYAMTLGNPLRRMLLSSIPGTAITWVKIDGVMHEYSTIPHVKEEVTELLMNFKGVRLRSLVDRPGKLRLDVAGEGHVTAADIITSADFEIVNPEHHLASLDSPEGRLSVEFNVEQGTGYVPASQSDGLPIGVLPIDAIYTPVQRVNYAVERTRVGQMTNYERLVLEVWTDNAIGPVEALAKASQLLVDHFFLLANVRKVTEADADKRSLTLSIPAEVFNTPVEKLELSVRTLNSLKRAHLNRIGEILQKDRVELLKIRNFGEKSLEELYTRLQAMGFMPQPEGADGGEVVAVEAIPTPEAEGAAT